MKLTQKLFAIFFVSVVITIVSVYFLSNHFFLNSFSEIEDEIAYRDLERVKQTVLDEIENLTASSNPWALMPETVELSKNPLSETIRREIETDMIFSSRFSQVFIVNRHQHIIFSKAFDWEQKKFQEVEPGQLQIIEGQLLPWIQKTPQEIKKGFFIGSEHRPFLMASWPLMTKAMEQPAGYFIVFREVDSALKKRFQDMLQLELGFSVGSKEEWSQSLSERGILLTGRNRIQGMVGFPDIFGKSNLIVRVDIRRAIYGLGQQTVWSFLILVSVFLVAIFGVIFFVFHRDALMKVVRIKKQMIQIGQGQLKRLSWSGHDEAAELAQTINQMLDQIEHSQVMINRASKFSALGEMAGSIAHEINNPLAIITGFCSRIIRMAANEEMSRPEIVATTERILNTAHRIDRIIQSLRLVSRDGERDAKQEVALGDILNEVITLSETALVHSNISLRLDQFDKNQKVTVRFVQIVQVLLNLLNNSIAAIAQLSDRWIEFRTESDGQFVHIYVTDSGEGIAPDLCDKIMEPFFTTKELGKGSGLGLSISKGIIESHNGTFTLVRSATHTTFKISLPR